MPNLLTLFLAATCVVLLILLGVAVRSRKSKSEEDLPEEWSLTPRPIFSPAERRLHRQLREALPQHVVLAKLPLVRFCQPARADQVRYWFDLLGSIHVGFAVCSANGRVLAAIDLDDGRAGGPRRSVQIKQAVLTACRIRYVRYPIDQTPSVPELQLLVPAASAVAATPAPAAMSMPLLGSAAAPRVAKRSARWPDSTYLKDSTFGAESSSFSNSLYSELPEGGGVVIEPAPPVRH